MSDAMDGVRRRQKSGGAQMDALDRVIAEMVVKPRPPGRAQRISRLQHAAQPFANAAPNQAEMAAAFLCHQFENDAGLAIALDAEHDAFIGPLHGVYVMRLAAIRRLSPVMPGHDQSHSFGNSNPICR